MKKLLFYIAAFALLFTSCNASSPYQTTTQKHVDEICETAPFPMEITVPKFPGMVYNILDYGAAPTGRALSHDAIQKAIDLCSQTGGGTVLIPAGVYITGPIELKSNVRLYTDYNALVLFSDDFELYPVLDASFEGLDTKRCQSPISARNAENIAITGHGTFNGHGDSWRPLKKNKVTGAQWKEKIKKGVINEATNVWFPDSASMNALALCQDQNVPVLPATASQEEWEAIRSFLRPVMVNLIACKNVLLEGVCFENSPAWNLHPFLCENVVLRDLNVRNPWYSQNGDGVDVESCKNVLIEDCRFDVGDDAICMKSGKNEDGRRRGVPAENIFVKNCVVYHGHGGFVVGSEMSGGVKNCNVEDCLFIGTDVGLRFKSTRGRGGVVENIFISRINMSDIVNEALLFDLFYGGKGSGEETEEEIAARMAGAVPEADETTPAFRDITIQDIICKGSKQSIYFNGLPEMKIQNVHLINIRMSGKKGAQFNQTNGLTLQNVEIEAEQGESIMLSKSVDNVSIE